MDQYAVDEDALYDEQVAAHYVETKTDRPSYEVYRNRISKGLRLTIAMVNKILDEKDREFQSVRSRFANAVAAEMQVRQWRKQAEAVERLVRSLPDLNHIMIPNHVEDAHYVVEHQGVAFVLRVARRDDGVIEVFDVNDDGSAELIGYQLPQGRNLSGYHQWFEGADVTVNVLVAKLVADPWLAQARFERGPEGAGTNQGDGSQATGRGSLGRVDPVRRLGSTAREALPF